MAVIATVVLVGAALPGLAVGTQRPLDALWFAAQGVLLQTAGDGLIRHWANQGFAVIDRVPTPEGDRVLMVRWPARPEESPHPEVSARPRSGPTSRGGRRGGTGG